VKIRVGRLVVAVRLGVSVRGGSHPRKCPFPILYQDVPVMGKYDYYIHPGHCKAHTSRPDNTKHRP
jgi:hypothetical protein